MKITMIVHREVTYDTRVQREARALVDAGHRVTVVQLGAASPSTRSGGYGFALVAVTPAAALKEHIPLKAYRLLYGLSVIRAALRTRPDVVHAHDVAMLAPAYAISRLTRARLVYDTHELAVGVPYRSRGWPILVRTVERLLVRRCDAIVTVSAGIARRLADIYGLDRLPIVLKNVPEEANEEAKAIDIRIELGIGDAPLILHQGAAAPNRGCEALIEAIRHVSGAHLLFLGGGGASYLAQLRALASRQGVSASVHFLPSVAPGDLLAHTRQADVGASLLEDNCENHRLALPNKVFEYVAAGIPVVSTDLPELRALIDRHGIGWTAPSGDIEALAAVLSEAVAHRSAPELQMRLRRAAVEFSWPRERQHLIELYSRLSAGRGAWPTSPPVVRVGAPTAPGASRASHR